MSPLGKRSAGFTLTELIVVILLIAIMSLYASSRYSGASAFSVMTSQSEILSSLRLVQNRAMNRSGYCNRWIVEQNQAIQVSPTLEKDNCMDSFPGSLTDASYVNGLESKVTLNLQNMVGTNYLDFDSLGRASQCLDSECVVTISSTQNNESQKVCINIEGYIYGC